MKEYLDKLPKEVRELIRLAADLAVSRSTPAYLVGGFVRDLLLGVENLDMDIVVENDGIGFAETLSAALKAKFIRHHRFGTATIAVAHPGLKIDIATARKEYYPQPAHLPVVEKGGLKDDLFRRDFTINAMALKITGKEFGQLIDFFGGKNDLIKKRIRVLHEKSFIDDPTRILRAIRFEKRYDFRIEPHTLRLLNEASGLKMLNICQPHRIRDEFILILKEKEAIKILKRIRGLTGFSFISPKLTLSRRILELLYSVQKEVSRFKKEHSQRRHLDAWLLYFMCLTEGLSPAETAKACLKFAFRKGEKKRILGYKRITQKLIAELKRKDTPASKVFRALVPISYEVILMLKAKYKDKRLNKHIEYFLKEYSACRIHVRGEDLRSLGIEPGPEYSRILTKVCDARLDGKVKSREDELELIKSLIKKL